MFVNGAGGLFVADKNNNRVVKLPAGTTTQFVICSISKSFTATGVAVLHDEGRLDWTKPVRDYLPEFRLHDAVATERVTVIDLLCHHTGLPRHAEASMRMLAPLAASVPVHAARESQLASGVHVGSAG